MRIPRLFVGGGVPIAARCRVMLPPAVAAHAARALRLRDGSGVVIFDGAGGAYQGRLVMAGPRDGVAVAVSAACPPALQQRPTPRLVLAHAVCAATDDVVRSATELGVAAIVPVVSARSGGARGSAAAACVGQDGSGASNSARAQGLQERWRAIAIAACEQSGRNTLPEIPPPVSFSAFLGPAAAAAAAAARDGVVRLVADPWGAPGLDRDGSGGGGAPAAVSGVTLLVGPEGGWTEGEVAAAERAGFVRFGAGPRVLRTETAAVALLAIVQHTWGDMRFGSGAS